MKERIHMTQIPRSFAWFTVAVVLALGRTAAAPASGPGVASRMMAAPRSRLPHPGAVCDVVVLDFRAVR
jgi:hypothetical protein